jgi:hypothetical protein
MVSIFFCICLAIFARSNSPAEECLLSGRGAAECEWEKRSADKKDRSGIPVSDHFFPGRGWLLP